MRTRLPLRFPSSIFHPPSSLRFHPSPRVSFAPRAFTLIELLVAMGIVSLLLVAVVPAVTSLSKAHGGKAAISNVMGLFEQARSLAVSSGNATYVVFADQNTPE